MKYNARTKKIASEFMLPNIAGDWQRYRNCNVKHILAAIWRVMRVPVNPG